MRGTSLSEFERIERYFVPLARRSAMSLGLQDDAALIPMEAGRELVVTTDAMVAGQHFFPDDPPAEIAQKLLRVNLSDLAAMAARPLGYLLVSAWRADTAEDWIAEFVRGLALDQERFDVTLLGGDTVATDGPLSFTVTALGVVARGQALRRAGARAGDGVYVSGMIGDAVLGLMIRQGELSGLEDEDRDYLLGRHRRPEPRLELGQALATLASAAIDVSDGLVADLGHLCAASAIGAVLEAALVPVSPAARRVLTREHGLGEALLAGGDDYELCLTLPPEHEAAALAAAAGAGVPLTAVGRVTTEKGVRVRNAEGRRLELGQGGFQHF